MHGEQEKTALPRFVWIVAHGLLVACAAWLLLAGGAERLGDWTGLLLNGDAPRRRVLLFLCGVVLWLRMTVTALVLLERRVLWSEVGAVLIALATYQLGFALLGAGAEAPLGVIDAGAVAIFVLGSALNTGSEVARRRFKHDPSNRGRLYTRGPFRLVRHPNYLGDLLWVSGWALLTRNPWAALIPLALFSGFVFLFIPQLSRYLAKRYGDDYRQWAEQTRRIIPFVY